MQFPTVKSAIFMENVWIAFLDISLTISEIDVCLILSIVWMQLEKIIR